MVYYPEQKRIVILLIRSTKHFLHVLYFSFTLWHIVLSITSIIEWLQIADPTTPHIKKEVIMQNVSPTEGTKNSNGDLMYMKVYLCRLPLACIWRSSCHFC
jgi:hypothetical protein